MLCTPVLLDDGRRVAASVGAAMRDTTGSRKLTLLQRAADAALYDGKHSGHATAAHAAHQRAPGGPAWHRRVRASRMRTLRFP